MIKELRKRKSLTQKQLGDIVGLTYQSVQKWESGRGTPTTAQLSVVSSALGVTVTDLLEGRMPDVSEGESGFFTEGNIASVRPHIKEFYTLVPFLTARAQAGIPLMSYENFTTDLIEETYPVFLPIIAINEKHLAIEIAGDSMEPSIIEGAVVLVESISKADIKYESGGVYAVLYGNGRFVVKRVKTNDLNTNGTLVLWSDNEKYGHIVVHGEDIHRMWKVIEKVREPVR
jgi:phage repressor protein C with HTH and peptisase S24 domain